MADLATAYLLLVPSLKGAEKTIGKELGGISGDVGDKAGGKLGDSMGEGLVGKMGGIAKRAAATFASTFAAKKLFDFGKAAFDAYADFEQLSGGVEKIFDEMDTSRIMDDANKAWLDLNMSANDYMESINQVGSMFAQTMGDEKGYDVARKGMKAISDYATGTGRDLNMLNEKFAMITRSTSSYQSIADQFAGVLPATSKDFLEQAQAAGLLGKEYENLTDVPVAEYQQALSAMLEKGTADLGLQNNTAKEALGTLSGSILATKSAWDNLVAEFGKPDADIGARIQDMLKAVMGEDGEGGLLRNVASEVGSIIGNIGSTIGGAIGLDVDTSGLVAAFQSFLPVAQQVGDTIGGIATTIGAFVAEHGQQMVDILSTIIGTVGSIASTLAPILPIVLGIVGALSGLSAITAVIGAISGAVGFFTGVVIPAFAAVQSFGGAIALITSLLGGPVTIIAALVGGLVAFIATNEDARNAILGVWEAIKSKFSEVQADIDQKIKVAGAVFGWLKEQAEKKLGEVIDFFKNLPQRIKDALGDVGSFLLQAGKDLIGGFVKGITDIGSTVTDAVSGVAEDALNGIKGFFGIASPSKLMMQMGGFVMEGFDEGIEGGAKQAARTMAGVGSMMTDALGQAYGQRRAVPAYTPRPAATGGSGWAGVESAVNGLRGDMAGIGIYLDGNVLVGHTATRMDKALAVV